MLGTMMAATPIPDATAPLHRPAWLRTAALSAAGLVLFVLVLLLAFELTGWRFLKEPLERRLSRDLGVPVAISAPFDLHLLRSPQLTVGSIRIGAPPASG